MQYVGGKSKIAKPLSEAILSAAKSRKYYLEPFVGGGAVFPKIAPHFEWSVAGDAQTDLVLMWNALMFEGWHPPMEMSREKYQELRRSDPSPERALAGFGGSFGGKWFGGYAKNNSGTNYIGQASRGLIKFRDAVLKGNPGRFRNWSYEQWNPAAGTVVYCDPPYANSQGYSTGGFDHDAFWAKCRSWVEAGCEVFVSEYAAPEDWTCIWEREKRVELDGIRKENNRVATERLFTLV